jgi:hypothetical protein
MAEEIASPSFVERVASASAKIGPARALFTLLALPFYVLGWVLGGVYVAIMFAVGAVKLGIADARARADRHPGGSS